MKLLISRHASQTTLVPPPTRLVTCCSLRYYSIELHNFIISFQQAYNAIAVSRQMKLMVLNSSGSNKSSSDKKEETNTTAAADAKEVAAQV